MPGGVAYFGQHRPPGYCPKSKASVLICGIGCPNLPFRDMKPKISTVSAVGLSVVGIAAMLCMAGSIFCDEPKMSAVFAASFATLAGLILFSNA